MSTAGTLYDETVLRGIARLFSSQTANNVASVTFLSGLEAGNGFEVFIFEVDNVYLVNGPMAFQVSIDGGASWVAGTSYWQCAMSTFSNFNTYQCYQSSSAGALWQGQLVLGHGAAASDNPWSARVKLYNPPSGFKHFTWFSNGMHSSYYSYAHMGGGHVASSNYPRVNGIKFFNAAGGNFTAGSIRMWGMRQL